MKEVQEMKQVDNEGEKVFRKSPQWRKKKCLKYFTEIVRGKMFREGSAIS